MNESLNVLIVDDDVSIQNVVEEILSDGGFEPQAASSVEEAIALLNAHRFRAIIIDISFGRDHVRDGLLRGGLGHSIQPCRSFISLAEILMNGRFREFRTAS